MKKYVLVIILFVSICLAWPLESSAKGGGHGGRGGGSRGGGKAGGHHISSPSVRPAGPAIHSRHPGHHPHHPPRHPHWGPYHVHPRHHWPHHSRWWVSAPYCPWWDYYCGPFWSWSFYGYYGSLDAPVFMFEDASEEGTAYYPIAPLPDFELESEDIAGVRQASPVNPPAEPGMAPP